MTQLTTLTGDQVTAVLLGLASTYSSATEADNARVAGIRAMAAALTTTRPVDPDLLDLRRRLAALLEVEPATEDEILRGIGTLIGQGGAWRDQLSALLDLDPWASDQEITDTAAARAAQRAQERAATKTQALVAGDELQQALAVLETRRARDDVERQALQVVRQHLDELDRRLTSAGKRIEVVRHLHPRAQLKSDDGTLGDYCLTCNAEPVAGTPARWPCPTISALDGS